MRIELVDVHFAYTSDRPILRGVSLALETGQCLALLGPTGAGKSTLARHLNGLLRPAKGAVLLDGRDIRARPVASLARHVGYVFQNPLHQLFAQSVRDEIGLAFAGGAVQVPRDAARERVEQTIRAFHLEELASRHPLSVSEGQRKRIALAAVLVARPNFLVLDEPTLGQDAREKRRLAALLTELRQDTGILLITHDVEFAVDCCDRLAILQEGRLRAEGPVEEVALDEPSFIATGSMPPQIPFLAAQLGWGRVTTVEQAFECLARR